MFKFVRRAGLPIEEVYLHEQFIGCIYRYGGSHIEDDFEVYDVSWMAAAAALRKLADHIEKGQGIGNPEHADHADITEEVH